MLDSLPTTIISILLTIFVLAFLIFVHELGHFLAAKAMGVRVEKFALGFGPVLWKRKWKGTEYSIRAIFLGGYVQMFGDMDASSSKRDMSLANHPESFLSKPLLAKIFILSAGVFMNIITGIVVFIIYLSLVSGVVGLQKIGDYNFIGAEEYPAFLFLSQDFRGEQAETGIILRFNNEIISSRSELRQILAAHEDKPINIELYDGRDIVERQVVLNGQGLKSNFDLDIFPLDEENQYRGIVTSISTDRGVFQQAIKENGLEVQDFEDLYILSIGGNPIYKQKDVTETIDNHLGEEVKIVMLGTDGAQKSLQVALPEEKEEGQPVLGIGIAYSNFGYEDDKVLLRYENVFTGGVAHAVNTIGYQGYALGVFIDEAVHGKPEQLTDNVGGVVAIGGKVNELVGSASQTGPAIFIDLLSMVGLISVVLAFMNILPIPVLDGGHIFILIIEKIIGRPLPDKVQELIFTVFFGLLLLMTVLVTIRDIVDLF